MIRSAPSASNVIRNQEGNVFILVAFGIIMLVSSIAVAVDMTRAFLVRSKAQSALDAALIGVASIAHVGISQAEINERAQNFLNANFPKGYMNTTQGDFTVTFDEKTGKVSGNLGINFTPAFKILGDNPFTIGTSGEITRILGHDLEIALALDHTSSMCAPLTCSGAMCLNQAPCSGNKANSRIQILRDGVNVFFDEINTATQAAHDPDAKVLYSYIPFNHDIKLNGHVMHRGANYLPNATGLREDSTPILTAMTNIQIRNTGNTNAAKGLAWGWRSLRRPDRNLFTGASAHQFTDHPRLAGDERAIKALILFTDGINEYTYNQFADKIVPECFPNGCPTMPDNNAPREGMNRGTAHANANQADLCDAIHKEGIRIFPIVLNRDTGSPAFAEIKAINDKCAAPAVEAYYPKTAEELRVVFRQIARQLVNLRITK